MREYTSTITFGRDRSRYRAVASDGKVQYGKTPNVVIADELHAWEGRAGQRQWEALDSALVKVPGTLMVVATTAGRGQENLAWKTIDYAIKVQKGEIDDPATLLVILMAEPDDNWRDEAIWHAVNPGMAHGYPDLASYRDKARKAINSPSDRDSFLQFNLNVWLDHSLSPFVEMAIYDKGSAPMDLDELAGEAKHNRKQREMDCEHCGKAFTRSLGKKNQRFYSPECPHEASKIERRRIADEACLQCGTMFRPKSDASKYCSATCMGLAFSAAMCRPPTTCEACGKQFRAVIPTRKFCSVECRAVDLREIPDKPRANCGTTFNLRMSKGKVSQYCSRACSGMAHRKELPELICETCKSVLRPAYASDKRRFCSPNCANLANKTFARYQCTPTGRR